MRRLQLVCLFVRSCKFSTVIPLQDGKAMGVDHAPTLRVGPDRGAQFRGLSAHGSTVQRRATKFCTVT